MYYLIIKIHFIMVTEPEQPGDEAEDITQDEASDRSGGDHFQIQAQCHLTGGKVADLTKRPRPVPWQENNCGSDAWDFWCGSVPGRKLLHIVL